MTIYYWLRREAKQLCGIVTQEVRYVLPVGSYRDRCLRIDKRKGEGRVENRSPVGAASDT